MNPFAKFSSIHRLEALQARLVTSCRLVPTVALFLVVNEWDNHTVNGKEEYQLLPYQKRRRNYDTLIPCVLPHAFDVAKWLKSCE